MRPHGIWLALAGLVISHIADARLCNPASLKSQASLLSSSSPATDTGSASIAEPSTTSQSSTTTESITSATTTDSTTVAEPIATSQSSIAESITSVKTTDSTPIAEPSTTSESLETTETLASTTTTTGLPLISESSTSLLGLGQTSSSATAQSSSTAPATSNQDPVCITNSNCQIGESCNNGQCTCVTTADCLGGVCDSGFCVAGTDCQDNSWCAPGQVCQFGVCVASSTTTTTTRASKPMNTGIATWYLGITYTGSICGVVGSSVTNGVAMSPDSFSASNCGRQIRIYGPAGEATATVIDECPTCAGIYDLDIATSPFEMAIGPLANSQAQVTWEYIS